MTTRLVAVAGGLLIACGWPLTAGAQLCRGTPQGEHGWVRASASAGRTVSEGYWDVSGEAGGVSEKYGALSLEVAHLFQPDRGSGRSWALRWALPLDVLGRDWALCPVLANVRGFALVPWADEMDFHARITTTYWVLGAAIARLKLAAPGPFSLGLFAVPQLVGSSGTIEGYTRNDSESVDFEDNYFGLSVGLMAAVDDTPLHVRLELHSDSQDWNRNMSLTLSLGAGL